MRVRYWHLVLGAFFLGWIFMYADRTVLSPVLSSIGAEWRLSTDQLGLISSLFFLAYAALQIPTGVLADRYGRMILLVPGYLLFGLTTALSALAPSYGAFLALGALTGFGEGTYYPAQFSLSSEAIPLARRGLGSAIINSGQAFGISLGLILSSFVAFNLQRGWRASFLVLGILTMVAGGVIWAVVREHPPREQHGDSGEAGIAVQRSFAGRPNTTGGSDAWRSLFTRDLILLYVVAFCSLYGFFVVLTWLPYYLEVARGVPKADTGWVSSLVPWASLAGALGWSYLSDRWRRRRLLALVLLPVAGLALLFVPRAPGSLGLGVALVVYGVFGKLALDPLLVAFVADRVPQAVYGRAFAFFNFAGMLSSIAAPYVTGVLAGRLGTLDAGFYLAVALLAVGTVCMALTRPERREVAVPTVTG
jgi:MFS family permease